MFENVFRQAMMYTPEADYQVLISKKYKVSILTKSPPRQRQICPITGKDIYP